MPATDRRHERDWRLRARPRDLAQRSRMSPGLSRPTGRGFVLEYRAAARTPPPLRSQRVPPERADARTGPSRRPRHVATSRRSRPARGRRPARHATSRASGDDRPRAPGSSHVDGPVPSTRAWIERSAARGMLSCRPAHAARQRDAGPGGSRSSSAWTFRRYARICVRARSRRRVVTSPVAFPVPRPRSAFANDTRRAVVLRDLSGGSESERARCGRGLRQLESVEI